MSYSKLSLTPPLPSTTRGTPVKLSTDPKGERLVYCNSRSVFLRSISGTGPSIGYSGHARDTTVAQVSPSGFYVASADVTGTVRVWDIAGEDQILKSEVKALGGPIRALGWDAESKRIIVGGDGRERFAHAFMFDSGSSVGEMSGHSKVINAVAVRQQRPFRAVTGGDDRTLIFSHGAPYKYAKSLTDHTGFVHDVAFSPNGEHFASVGADSKLLLYTGPDANFVSSMSSTEKGGHKGGIFAVSWERDSSNLVTSGSDRTVKVWDVEKQSVVQTWSFDDAVENQQVGVVWSPSASGEIISASLNGELNVFDKRTGNAPTRIIYGHQKAIVALSGKIPDSPTFFSGSYDGKVNSFTFSETHATCKPVTGAGHSNSIVALSTSDRSEMYTAGMDDSVRIIETSECQFGASSTPTTGQPTALAVDGQNTQYVANPSEVQVLQGGKQTASIKGTYQPQSVAVSAAGLLAVGGTDGKIYLYTTSSQKPHTVPVLEKNRGTITALAFSPDAGFLAAGDANGKIVVYKVPSGEVQTAAWAFHTAKISSIAWSLSSKRAVSGSLDTNTYVWNIVKPLRNIAIKNAHAGGVGGVGFLDENTVVSAGADAAVKTWKVQHHAV